MDNCNTWKSIPISGFEHYEINHNSDIRNINNKKSELNAQVFDGVYKTISLRNTDGSDKHFLVHRLMGITFIPNESQKLTIDHIDQNPINNHILNLRWATQKEQAGNKKIINNKNTGNRPVFRLNSDTLEIYGRFDTIVLAAKWVFDVGLSSGETFDTNKESSIATNIRRIARQYNDETKQFKPVNCKAFGFKWKYCDSDIEDYVDEYWVNIDPKIIRDEEGFKISTYGRIKNSTKKYKDIFSNKQGYLTVSICGLNYLVHRLVAKTFIPNDDPLKIIVNHKDCNKQNPHVSNLEWVTRVGNAQHALDNERLSRVQPIIHYDIDGRKIKEFKSYTKAAQELGLNRKLVSKCCRNKKHCIGFFRFQFRNKNIINLYSTEKYAEKNRIGIEDENNHNNGNTNIDEDIEDIDDIDDIDDNDEDDNNDNDEDNDEDNDDDDNDNKCINKNNIECDDE
jgi:hypothetical protein